MKNSGFRKLSGVLALMSSVFGTGSALAQTSKPAAYPTAPIRFIVPFAAGSGNDIVSRRIGQLLSESLRQSVVIENRDGAGGMIGITQVTKSAPDGYTIGMGSPSTLAMAPYMMKEPPYDPVRDLAPITLIAATPFVMVVHPRTAANTLAEYITYAKANRGKLNYSSAGKGTTHHLAVEMFNSLAGTDFSHVPYKGAAPATVAVVSGEIDMIFGPILSTVPLLQSKQLKALAISSAQRSTVLPDVPTIAESGYPGYQSVNWYGIVAPRGTPPAIVDVLNREIVRIIGTPDIRNQLLKEGARLYGNTAKEFTDFIASESANAKKVIKQLSLVME